MEIAEHIATLERDGIALADAAATAGLATDVPTCPGWRVRDLVRHQAYVHGWAARHVRDRLPEILDGGTEQELLAAGLPDAELISAYRAGHAALVATLREADPDAEYAAFLPAPSALAFWARRQAHETAIHSYDAQAATAAGPPGPEAAFAPAFASDGIDELMSFAGRRRPRPRGDDDRSLMVRATDAPGRWHVRFSDGVAEVGRGEADADCVAEGPASGLYLLLWNRCGASAAGVKVIGDSDLLHAWSVAVRIRWR